jgi:hypothetical protein
LAEKGVIITDSDSILLAKTVLPVSCLVKYLHNASCNYREGRLNS